MSTRTYNFRSRTETGNYNHSRMPATTEGHLRPLTGTTRDQGNTRESSLAPSEEPLTALYSDVAASRPPSPRRENRVEIAQNTSSNSLDSEIRVDENNNPVPKIIETTSVNEENTPELDGDEALWTTVKHRRARSLSSLESTRALSKKNSSLKKRLTDEQSKAVKKATSSMTVQQKETLRRRKERLPFDLDESESSQEEGPSKDKGKGIDPREWGNVNISQESLDQEAQAAALASIVNIKHEKEKNRPAHRGKTKRPDHRSQPVQLPAESRPVAQIAPRSYLGMALNNVGRRERKGSPEGGSPYPSDPSSESDGETSYSDDTSSMEESPKIPPKGGSRSRRSNRHGRNKHRRRRSSSSGTRPLIKPIPPKDYDGKAEPRAYYRFVRESEAYLRDGKIRGRRQIFLLSYYLTGKAYDFYTQRVSSNEDKWTLCQFYDELFNFCFPIDYRMRLRKDLARCHQNEKSVSEYTHELYELFNMIGDIPERDRVLKFWNGARSTIQKGLWRDNLNPETSSWDLVVAQAEIIEISENVVERRDKRNGSISQAGGSYNNPKTSQSGNKGPSTPSAARSVSYDTRGHTPPENEQSFPGTFHPEKQ